MRLRVLLVDNSKPECAIFTPKLFECLSKWADVTACRTRTEAIACVDGHWDAVVLSGSSLNMSQSVHTAALAKDLMMLLRFSDTPCLGVCFGMQLMAVAYGGEVSRLEMAREGAYVINANGPLLNGSLTAYFSHQDVVVEVPPDFVVDAEDATTGLIVGMRCDAMLRYGVQYHPECSDASVQGLIRGFLSLAEMRRIPVTADLRISKREWGEIALMVGNASIHRVASQFKLSVEHILHIWNEFRLRYRIPAMLI